MATRARKSDPMALALAETAGASLVLDERMRVLVSTRAANELLGFTPEPGASAARVLCGTRDQRPVAEALARGLAVDATIPSPRGDGTAFVRVQGRPLGPARTPSGFLLTLSRVGPVESDDAIDFHGFITADPATKQVLRIVEKVAVGDATVLVRGETGTGKELIARAVHDCSKRSRGPFRALNCAALPPTLLESELFGHARGAFTGAIRDVPGHVELADGGTLFLDEVAELPLELQAKLLRMLETRTVIPVGAREPIRVDVRIVSATHRSMRAEVEAGRFRADLMYRLRVVPIQLPPLRERSGDIALLTGRLVDEANRRGGRVVERIDEATLAALRRYDFPGNVRELRNALEYAYAVGEGPVLVPGDLPAEMVLVRTPIARVGSGPVRGGDESPDRRLILAALERSAGHRGRAATILGMSRVTLWRKMRELAIEA